MGEQGRDGKRVGILIHVPNHLTGRIFEKHSTERNGFQTLWEIYGIKQKDCMMSFIALLVKVQNGTADLFQQIASFSISIPIWIM